MLARDYLQEIAWSFRKQRLRTALTSVGIAIGAFAIAVMVGLGQGVESYIEQQVLNFGNPRVLIVFPDSARAAERFLDRISSIGKPARRIEAEDEEDRKRRRGGLMITPDQVAELRALPGVASVAPMTWLEVDGIALGSDVPHDVTVPAETFFETDFAALVTHPLVGTPAAGRLPPERAGDADEELEESADDDRVARGEVVISPHYAQSFRMAPEELVGREVALRVPYLADITQRFAFRDPSAFRAKHRIFRAKVVGLSERSPVSRAVFASIPLGRQMMRYQSGKQDILSDQKIGFQVHVRVAESADLAETKKAIRKIGLLPKSVDDQVAEITRGFLVVKLALSAFGLLAVLVATFGIANTLLMAISERTREIGVMKALGASEATIRRMFAAEAAAIGFVGGAVGTGAAIALGSGLNLLAGRLVDPETFGDFRAFAFPWWLILGAIAFATVVGMLAGIYPANRAARLDPIEALRHE